MRRAADRLSMGLLHTGPMVPAQPPQNGAPDPHRRAPFAYLVQAPQGWTRDVPSACSTCRSFRWFPFAVRGHASAVKPDSLIRVRVLSELLAKTLEEEGAEAFRSPQLLDELRVLVERADAELDQLREPGL
jgi:hypothetical protein